MKKLIFFLTTIFSRLKFLLTVNLRFLIIKRLKSFYLKVKRDNIKATFICGSFISYSRIKKFSSKENSPLNWIDNFTNKDDIVLDIGANIGVISIYSGLKNLKVYSVESNYNNFYALLKNIELNNLTNINPFPFTISNKNEKFQNFYYHNLTEGIGSNSIVKRIDKNNYHSYKVQTISLTNFVEEFSKDINHIKIDIEDSIYSILDDLTNIINNKKIKSFHIELSKIDKYMDQNNFLINNFKKNNYKFLKYSSYETADDYVFYQ